MNKRKKCPICKGLIKGRPDKKFCSVICKSDYHRRLAKHTNNATKQIDCILHRNRSILQEILGKKTNEQNIPMSELDSKKFNYKYITGYHKNSMNKMVHYVYDFSWMIFSDKNVLIKRLKRR